MEHRTRDARGRRSWVLAQIAVCVFFFLAFATLPIVPSTEARVPTLVDGTPFPVLATPVLATPAATPLPGQPKLDNYTVALYRFDAPGSTAFDETWRYPGWFNGGASITSPGLYRGALSLPGPTSFVGTGNLPALNQGTLEAFVDFQSACQTAADYYSIITAQAADSGDTILALKVSVGLTFGIYSDGLWHWASSGINACRYLSYGPSAPGWPYETWRFHHVAGTWGPRGLEIWVDGVLHGVGNNDPDADISPYPYMCNPQMQLGDWPWPPNPLYPVCQTPVVAPRMPAYPPGDYTGGIPSASLVIGCGRDRCFNGRIDEVRVSNIQRTFSVAVVPTITPTPTHTPVYIGSQYAPDSNTTGLYHLDQHVWMGADHFTKDAVNEQWDAVLEGNAALTPGGRFDSGMALDGSYSWGMPSFLGMSPTIVPPGPIGAFEAWVNLAPDSPDMSPFFAAGNQYDLINFGLYPPAPGHIAFRVDNGDVILSNDTQIMRSDLVGSWHHVAATWGGRGLEVWLDGMLCNSVEFSGTFPDVKEYIAAGCDRNGHCMKGGIDEVRVSNVQRRYSPVTGQSQRWQSLFRESSASYSVFFPFIVLAPTPARVPCKPL